ncbi:MAG: hypothetical protein HY645_05430 [Acidobacteria bacterium]|nr:hypothetical protein [Acidobacteriota bacterium]
MKCRQVRRKIQESLNAALTHHNQVVLEGHLEKCLECRQYSAELYWIRQAVSISEPLPRSLSDQLWLRIERQLYVGMGERLRLAVDRFLTFWKDLEPITLWTRLGAVPITLLFFLVLIRQFPPVQADRLSLPVLSLLQSSVSVFPRAHVTEVPVLQKREQFNGLVRIVWRTPYEDSLSVVAEISPEGRAEIEDVLQYPKNRNLLEALDVALRRSFFETGSATRPFLIYSFQKIDVYGEAL